MSADLTGVGMPGEKGARADGRMAAVGMVWPPGRPGQVRYVCGLTGGRAVRGDPLRRQAAQVGMDAADRGVALSDGGAGIEDWRRTYVPRPEAVILDFWHAAQHLSEWAKALHPDDAAESTRVAGEWCHRLKHEGGPAGLEGLRAIPVGRRAAAKEAHRQLLGDVENQGHRMDDPAYRAKGWAIGAGPVEAACQQVVNPRLKGTGARWSGADAVCHLRALFRSELGQWHAFWANTAV